MAEIEALAQTPELEARLVPREAGLQELPELRTTEEGAARLRHGNPGFIYPGAAQYGDTAWASLQGKAVAIGQVRGGELFPSRVLAPVAPAWAADAP